jgi:CubicO group peptidase (beta-lactamase class C family)
VLSRSYGLAHLETRMRATPESQYRLASLTKQFTAMAIMLLAEQGKLRYDDQVVDVLPGFPAYLREIRIRHLLNHTSGIWDYEDFVPSTQTVQVKDRDVLALLSRTDRTYFPPGTAVRYSNSGYAVLALVVEQASGVPFARFLHDRIFAPIGMRSTVAYEAGISAVPQRAYGYVAGAEGFSPRDQSPTSAVLGGWRDLLVRGGVTGLGQGLGHARARPRGHAAARVDASGATGRHVRTLWVRVVHRRR